MSDQDDWEFADAEDAKAEIRAAVRYLLEGAAGSDRGDIVREIIEIVGEVARELAPGGEDPLDDGMPGG
jgi:predicted RNA-binding protein with EMAP domain